MGIKDLAGRSFGRLSVVAFHGKRQNTSHAQWLCKCECGNSVVVDSTNLLRGLSRSCGCLRKQVTGKLNRSHGRRRSRVYGLWCGMIARCRREADYVSVAIDPRWLDFKAFYADMGEPRPANDGWRDRKATELFGEFACLNFPATIYETSNGKD